MAFMEGGSHHWSVLCFLHSYTSYNTNNISCQYLFPCDYQEHLCPYNPHQTAAVLVRLIKAHGRYIVQSIEQIVRASQPVQSL
jgi:hypothetical protein